MLRFARLGLRWWNKPLHAAVLLELIAATLTGNGNESVVTNAGVTVTQK